MQVLLQFGDILEAAQDGKRGGWGIKIWYNAGRQDLLVHP